MWWWWWLMVIYYRWLSNPLWWRIRFKWFQPPQCCPHELTELPSTSSVDGKNFPPKKNGGKITTSSGPALVKKKHNITWGEQVRQSLCHFIWKIAKPHDFRRPFSYKQQALRAKQTAWLFWQQKGSMISAKMPWDWCSFSTRSTNSTYPRD